MFNQQRVSRDNYGIKDDHFVFVYRHGTNEDMGQCNIIVHEVTS